jgi:hypothetical protein
MSDNDDTVDEMSGVREIKNELEDDKTAALDITDENELDYDDEEMDASVKAKSISKQANLKQEKRVISSEFCFLSSRKP